jgi:molecular chaperone GrpE (heat shock protein)/8-oxo-dGTP pyrophosphatase MutT (NUDIX family)
MKNLQPGIYRHYKGEKYELLFLSENTENKEELVVYRSLSDNKIWSRPATMWQEEVSVDGKRRARFSWLSESHPRYPEPVVGPLIYNDAGEILLIKNNKMKGWSIPGGHIEWGEKMEETLIREIAEETSLQIDRIEFVVALDGIKPASFIKERHFIFLNFFAHLAGGEVTLSPEVSEYIWIDPHKALAELNIAESIVGMLNLFISRRQESAKDDFEDKYKRALADYQNLSKQVMKDKDNFAKFALSDFLQDLLPVYDHLKMSLSSLPEMEKDSAWVKGVEYVLKQFKDALAARGVEEIKTLGENFDHNLMEALDGQGDKVVKEVMPGYILNGRVIRAAKVIVE